eukprot:sb/3470217/
MLTPSFIKNIYKRRDTGRSTRPKRFVDEIKELSVELGIEGTTPEFRMKSADDLRYTGVSLMMGSPSSHKRSFSTSYGFSGAFRSAHHKPTLGQQHTPKLKFYVSGHNSAIFWRNCLLERGHQARSEELKKLEIRANCAALQCKIKGLSQEHHRKVCLVSGWAWYLCFQPLKAKTISTLKIGVEIKSRGVISVRALVGVGAGIKSLSHLIN